MDNWNDYWEEKERREREKEKREREEKEVDRILDEQRGK